jgi:hypothetical protein
MSKLNRQAIPLDKLETLLTDYDKPINYRLTRESDGLTKMSHDVKWLEFNDDGTFHSSYPEPAVGRSLIMSPFNACFTWQTTPITEIVDIIDDIIVFKTSNSTYTLIKIN